MAQFRHKWHCNRAPAALCCEHQLTDRKEEQAPWAQQKTPPLIVTHRKETTMIRAKTLGPALAVLIVSLLLSSCGTSTTTSSPGATSQAAGATAQPNTTSSGAMTLEY